MIVKKVIFDMDGLIFDSERLFMRELGHVMKKNNYILTEENYKKMLGLTQDALYNMAKGMYGDSYPHYEISAEARRHMDKIARENGLPIKNGIHELLIFLKEKNIPCVVASSTHREYIELYLKTSGLDEYFSAVTGGDMVGRSKPAPDIFLYALGDTPPQNALVLEDSKNGILASHNAGIPVICIPDMTYPDEEIKPFIYATVNSASDVINLIK